MKKKKFYWKAAIIFIIHLFIFFSPTALPTNRVLCDGAQSNYEEKLNESIYELLDKLDVSALQAYIDTLDFSTVGNVSQRLIEWIKGTPFDYENFGKQILDVLLKNIREIIPPFACIAAIALLSGLIASLRGGTMASTTADMIYFISYVAALIPLIAVLVECFEKTVGGMQAMQTQMQLIYPIMLTLMATSGGTITVSVCQPAVAFFSTSIVSLMTKIVLPIAVTIIAFSMASNLSKELKINKFTAFFKSINKWLIGMSISVFGLFFTMQGITVSTYDGIARRAAKYAIGTGIPIVGGFLSGGFDLAVAGSILIKNSLGSMSVLLLVSVLFEPLLLLLTVNLLLRFTSAITQPLSDGKISDFLGETADNLHYCSATLLFTAFLYFLSIVLLVTATEAML